MKQVWTYKARNNQGEAITGEMEADSKRQVLESLMEKHLIPTDLKPRREKFNLAAVFGNFGSANREQLIIFTRNLLTLYRAGIPILRALTIIGKSGKELRMEEELQAIKSDLQSGWPLSRSMARFPKKFPPIYVASVAAGEASGTLDEVLDQMAIVVEKEMILTRQIKAAIRYPIIVIVAITLAIFVIMAFVIPRFASMYSKFGADLPLPTKIVIGTSNFISSYWYLIIIMIGLGGFGLKKYLSKPKGQLQWDKLMLKIPIIGDMVLKANIARFAIMLKSLFKSGVPMVSCLKILKETSSNKAIAEEIGLLSVSFEKGKEIGGDPKKYKIFPNMALEMFQVGLESGSIEEIMGELASHYEMELEYKSRNLTALLEPLLTVVIGGIVLVLALSIFLPMWNLIKVFK